MRAADVAHRVRRAGSPHRDRPIGQIRALDLLEQVRPDLIFPLLSFCSWHRIAKLLIMRIRCAASGRSVLLNPIR